MEKIIKLQSDNQFAEDAKPTLFTTCKLLDFTIPGNATYDLGKSFISINMGILPVKQDAEAAPTLSTANDTALFNAGIQLRTDDNDAYVVQSACLVRNCQMESQNRGMVEHIQRVDTLRQSLFYLENDKQMTQDRTELIGSQQGRRGIGQQTTSAQQCVVRNVDNAGVAETTLKSIAIDREYRIPLADLFGVGNAMWNGEVYGPTRIHLEMNTNKLQILGMAGDEDTELGPSGVGFGIMDPQTNIAPGTNITVFTSTNTYKDYGLEFPFHVGQALNVEAEITNGGASPAQNTIVVIDSIDYNNNNNLATPGGNEKMTITTRSSIFLAPAAGGGVPALQTVSIKITGYKIDEVNSQIRIRKADLVLSEQLGEVGPSEIDYRTYVSEIQVGTGNNYFHQYAVEAEAQNLLIAHCDSNEIAPNRAWFDYRISIDNIDQTGNRSVDYRSSLHQDRILRFFNNRGQNVDSLGLTMIDTELLQGVNNATRANQIPFYPLLETLPITSAPKDVQIQMVGGAFGVPAAIQDVILYKEIIKTI